MGRAPRWLVAFAVALVVSTVAGFFVFALGLILPETLSYPLAFAAVALLAALGAGWLGTLLSPDGRRSRLPAIAGVTELVALAALVVVVALRLGPLARTEFFNRNVYTLLLATVVVSATASTATWRLRTAAGSTGRDAGLTLGLLALAVAAIVATIAVASLFGIAGA
jgi:hypothetical protein